jgi:hypothetical protein
VYKNSHTRNEVHDTVNATKRGRPPTGRTTTIVRVSTPVVEKLRLVAAARGRTLGEQIERYLGKRLDRDALAALAGGK